MILLTTQLKVLKKETKFLKIAKFPMKLKNYMKKIHQLRNKKAYRNHNNRPN